MYLFRYLSRDHRDCVDVGTGATLLDAACAFLANHPRARVYRATLIGART